VRLAVCRGLEKWELAEHIARTLIKQEPENIMHVVALAEVMGHREGPVAAAAVYEFAIYRFPYLRSCWCIRCWSLWKFIQSSKVLMIRGKEKFVITEH
jgi:hypothetical protein